MSSFPTLQIWVLEKKSFPLKGPLGAQPLVNKKKDVKRCLNICPLIKNRKEQKLERTLRPPQKKSFFLFSPFDSKDIFHCCFTELGPQRLLGAHEKGEVESQNPFSPKIFINSVQTNNLLLYYKDRTYKQSQFLNLKQLSQEK